MKRLIGIFTMWREIATAVVMTSVIATGAVAYVTRDIREAVKDVAAHQQRSDSLQVVVLRTMAVKDSVWRSQTSDVLDLMVIVLLEPPSRKSIALEELRDRRHLKVID